MRAVDFRGCTWVKKQIKRTANRLFLGSEHREFHLINSVKNETKKNYVYFYLYSYHLFFLKSEQRGQKMGKK